jgi:cyanophycin synthetase
MFERVTRDECFDLFLHAARKLGVEVRFLVDETTPLAVFSYDDRRVLIYENCTDLNDGAAVRILKDKYLTSQILSSHGIPVPRSVLVPRSTHRRALEPLVADLQRPLVVKPVSGSGGKGISVGLSTPSELWAAVRFARKRRPNILVEEQVSGEDFRIVLMDGEVQDVVQRHPALVVGEGELSIRELIDQKNERRREAGIDQRVVVDASLKKHLREHGLSLRSTPKRGECVRLQEICNVARGGENEKLPVSDVHPDNIALFKHCLEAFPLRLVGLDFITPDIRKSHREVGGAFNEINSTPMLCYLLGLEYDTASSIEVLRRCLKI